MQIVIHGLIGQRCNRVEVTLLVTDRILLGNRCLPEHVKRAQGAIQFGPAAAPGRRLNILPHDKLLPHDFHRLAHCQFDHRFAAALDQLSKPVIKLAMRQAMTIKGQQFVMGQDIQAATRRSSRPELDSTLCSFDMLGEAAVTEEDAVLYQQRYLDAIAALANQPMDDDLHNRHAISVKLSALHARYESAKPEVLLAELLPRFRQLALAAREAGIGLTMDAEEADRLEISLAHFIHLLRDPRLQGWNGLGLAVQAFQKRALPVLQTVAQIAQQTGLKIPVRLVKGAYWDTEIKRAQELGLESYPVFTLRVNTG